MPMGAAAYVSTNFLHKKEHIARNLLRVLMGYYTKLGTAVGCRTRSILRSIAKWDMGIVCRQISICRRQVQSVPSGTRKIFVLPKRKRIWYAVLDYYHAFAKRTNGSTIHPYMDPHRIFDMPYVVLCRKEGRITGYLTFEFVEVEHYTDMYHDLCGAGNDLR